MTKSKRPITADDLNRIHYVQSPQISPDGRHAAFVKVTPDPLERSYQRNIWLLSLESQHARQLTRGNQDSQPAWSPDGAHLAFVSGRSDKPQIFVLPTSGLGGEARPLTALPNGAGSPAWSPDGKQIAFLAPMRAEERAEEDAPDRTESDPLDKLGKRHRDERRDEDERLRWDPRPMWRIPYRRGTSFVDERYQQIYVIATEESNEAKPRRLTNLDADYSQPRWSADGEAIYTSRAIDPESDEPWRAENVFRIEVTTGHESPLTDGESSVYAPLPSPDGKWIACGRSPIGVTDVPMRLLVIATDGNRCPRGQRIPGPRGN